MTSSVSKHLGWNNLLDRALENLSQPEELRFILLNIPKGKIKSSFLLLNAARDGYVESVKVLLEIKYTTSYLIRAMEYAAQYGQLNTLPVIIERLPRKALKSSRFIGMELAAEAGHLETVRFLISIGCLDSHKSNALFQASRNGHASIVSCLASQTPAIKSVFWNLVGNELWKGAELLAAHVPTPEVIAWMKEKPESLNLEKMPEIAALLRAQAIEACLPSMGKTTRVRTRL